jgi:hypothetical protein
VPSVADTTRHWSQVRALAAIAAARHAELDLELEDALARDGQRVRILALGPLASPLVQRRALPCRGA